MLSTSWGFIMMSIYEKVFEKKGSIYTKNRWVEFDFGNKLSIYNKLYDEEKISIYLIQKEILLKFVVILNKIVIKREEQLYGY